MSIESLLLLAGDGAPTAESDGTDRLGGVARPAVPESSLEDGE